MQSHCIDAGWVLPFTLRAITIRFALGDRPTMLLRGISVAFGFFRKEVGSASLCETATMTSSQFLFLNSKNDQHIYLTVFMQASSNPSQHHRWLLPRANNPSLGTSPALTWLYQVCSQSPLSTGLFQFLLLVSERYSLQGALNVNQCLTTFSKKG